MRSIAIVVTITPQVDLQYLVHFLEQGQGLIDRRLTHRRELGPDPCIELSRAGMPFAGGYQTHQLDPLGGQPEIAFSQRSDQFIKSDPWISHREYFQMEYLCR